MSPVSGAGAPRRFVGYWITTRCFRISAREAENGFIPPENCFVVSPRTKHWREKSNDFSQLTPLLAEGNHHFGHRHHNR